MGNDYINVGVLLINCDFWNELGMPKKWRDAAGDYDNLGFQVLDQCVLNFLFKDSYALLPSKFNFLASVPQEVPFNEISIIHFAGTSKPWHFSEFNLRASLSTLSSRDLRLYKTFQNNLIRELRESNEAESLTLSNIAKMFTSNQTLLSHIKFRIYVISFTYPFLRKLARLRSFLTELPLKPFRGLKNI
jgi:lipopolysaccharide biosynthesis glycosyltransferase